MGLIILLYAERPFASINKTRMLLHFTNASAFHKTVKKVVCLQCGSIFA